MNGCTSRPAAARRSRRSFLAALGAGAIASQFGARRAWADDAGEASRPLRFVGVFMPHGCAYELWKPGPNFDLTYPDCSLAPFDDAERFGRSYKHQLLVIDGLDLAAGIEMGTVGHDASRVILTGSGVTGKNPSIDQYLAAEKMLGADTPHTSLTLAVGNDTTELGANISYARGGVPVPKFIDPEQVFDELFGAPLTEKGKQELHALRLRRRSVLDFVRADLQQLTARAGTVQRTKLDQHQTALREIEKRLTPNRHTCRSPARPDAAQFPKLKSFGAGEPYFETITNLHIDLLARALSCDMTRFSTLMLADLTRTGLYPELPDDVHQDVAHRYWSESNMGPGRPDTWRLLAIQNAHTHKQIVRLMQRLDEAGVLDDTLIFAQSDMGDTARHSSRNVPTLIAGGCGGRWRMGREVDLRASKSDELQPSNHLLVSICRLFGIEQERYGSSASAATVTGSLDALLV